MTNMGRAFLFIVFVVIFIGIGIKFDKYVKLEDNVITEVARVTDPELDSLIREEKRVTDSVNIVLRKKESLRIIEARRESVRGMSQKEYEEVAAIRSRYYEIMRMSDLRRIMRNQAKLEAIKQEVNRKSE